MASMGPLSIATSALVVGLSGCTVVYGLELTRYEAAAFDRVDAPSDVAANYSNLAGLRGRARRALVPEYALAAASSEEIENVLAVEPTNGRYWLALAENLQDGGGDRGRMLAALHMSEAVQPREAATMGLRAAFILSLWDELPETDRRLSIAHLVELGERLPGEQRQSIAHMLESKSEPTRSEIRAALLQKTGGDRRLSSLLGL